MFPGFVDPHVHLRTPGREDEEDLESGTRAAAAGGFCAVLAMPNTDPVVDSAPVLRSLQERAADEAVVPVGFLAAITKGQSGTELTEMAELAREGAAGFSDDGFPVADAHRMRQALQYQRLAGCVLALHEEDPALSGNGVMHEGAVSTTARPGGDPVDLGEHGDRARRPAGALRGRADPHPAPLRRRVGRGRRAGARRGRRSSPRR